MLPSASAPLSHSCSFLLAMMLSAACASRQSHEVATAPGDGLAAVTRVTPNVLAVRDSAYASNMTIVRTASGLFIVDNFMSRSATAAALRAAERVFGALPVVAVVNTHGHDDHVWGNQLMGGAPIVAHARTAAYVRNRVDQMRIFFQRGPAIAAALEDTARMPVPDTVRRRVSARAERIRQNLALHADLTVTPPSVAIERDTTLQFGTSTVHVYEIGSAHSSGDLVVFIPAERLLIVGDLARDRAILGLDETDGDLRNWIAGLTRLLGLADPAPEITVTPGHGRIGDPGTLRTTRDYLTVIDAGVRAVRARGGTLDDALREVRADWASSYEYYVDYWPLNVRAAWRLAERGS